MTVEDLYTDFEQSQDWKGLIILAEKKSQIQNLIDIRASRDRQ